jgi:hypothetical protein
MLQREGMSFVDSRDIYDVFLEDYPEFANYYWSDDVAVAENELFEKPVMRIARSLPLSEEQQAIMVQFQNENTKPPAVVPSDDAKHQDKKYVIESYSETLERKIKRHRIETEAEKHKKHVKLDVLPGTSMNCERLFSTSNFLMCGSRKRTSPELFEALILLKVNRSDWDVYSVGQAMGRTSNGEEDIYGRFDMESDCNAF